MRYEYETLPGRTGEGKRIIAKPMTYKEYLELVYGIKIEGPHQMYNKIDFLNAKFEEYLLTGGLPAVINDYLSNGKISDEFYDIYVKWIVGDIEKYKFNSNTAKAILKKIIMSLGSKVSWESLNEYAGVSHVTVAEYVDIFERSFLVNYYYNSTSGLVDSKKRKKIYFIDPFFYFCVHKWVFGEANMFYKANEMLKDTKLLGLIKENCVSSFLWQQETGLSDTIDYKTKISFFSPSKGKEVDFVYDGLYLEVKSEDSNRKAGIVLTKDKFEKNKIPLVLFLLSSPQDLKSATLTGKVLK
jgi:predicted AAA+ superfamily ATPase